MSYRSLRGFFLAALLLAAGQGTVHAEDGFIDEMRFGGSWVDFPIGAKPGYYGFDRAGANAELLLRPANIDFFNLIDEGGEGLLHDLVNPRLHLGATIALEDETTSSVYAGLTWHFPITELLFVETSFGGAIHDGELHLKRLRYGFFRRGLGSRVLFRESIGAGMALTDKLNALVQISHMSHANLAGGENAGQTDLALKLGWKF